MMQMLELAEKYFKIAFINVFKDLNIKIVFLSNQMENLSKEMQTTFTKKKRTKWKF